MLRLPSLAAHAAQPCVSTTPHSPASPPQGGRAVLEAAAAVLLQQPRGAGL